MKNTRGGKIYDVIVELETEEQIYFVESKNVLDKLLFITNRQGLRGGNARGGWTDHFQFSIISIRDEDFITLIKHGTPLCDNYEQLIKEEYFDLVENLYTILCNKDPSKIDYITYR